MNGITNHRNHEQEKECNSEEKGKEDAPPASSLLELPQVKICGLMRVDEALACVEAGAGAIGLVFYGKSPRNVTEEQARDICHALPPGVPGVGVFVNESFSFVMGKAERCGLRAVQLHGKESPAMVQDLLREGLTVIKALFENGEPPIASADSYQPSACLVECAGGPLPGGNAMEWDWSAAANLARNRPVVLAGGLSAENVGRAVRAALPDAVDISSGVEDAPGKKNIDKVKRFLEAVSQNGLVRKTRRIFK